jgi:hypothetical protein
MRVAIGGILWTVYVQREPKENISMAAMMLR